MTKVYCTGCQKQLLVMDATYFQGDLISLEVEQCETCMDQVRLEAERQKDSEYAERLSNARYPF